MSLCHSLELCDYAVCYNLSTLPGLTNLTSQSGVAGHSTQHKWP